MLDRLEQPLILQLRNAEPMPAASVYPRGKHRHTVLQNRAPPRGGEEKCERGHLWLWHPLRGHASSF